MRSTLPLPLRSPAHLFAGTVLSLLVPVALIAAVIGARLERDLREQAELHLGATTELASQVVDEHLDGLVRDVERGAGNPEIVAGLVRRELAGVRAILQAFVDGNPKIARAFVADARGVLLVDAPPLDGVVGVDFSHREWFTGASAGPGTFLTGVYRRAAVPRVLTVAVATPLSAGDEVVGYFVAQHTLQDLADRLAEIRPSQSGSLLLVDRHGVVAWAVDRASAEWDGEADQALPARIPIPEGRILEAPDPLDGSAALLGIGRIRLGEFTIIAREPLASVNAPVRRLQGAVILACLFGLCLATAVVFPVSNWLRRENARVVALEESKSLLTSMIVHDLRNPLTISLTLLDALVEDLSASDERRKDAEGAREACRRMLSMVSTLLDIAQMEDGKKPLRARPSDVVRLLEARVKEYEPAARAKGLGMRFATSIPEATAEVDTELIGRVLDNLLSNALKHTVSGEIVVGLEREEGELRIAVRDTGEGISKDAQPGLFEKYARVRDQKHSTPYDTGLGLVFCRMAAELHGGRIDVQSDRGHGAVFSVHIPVHAEQITGRR